MLITISSSGNSENIIQAIQTAKKIGLSTLALSGFDGGRSSEADIHINVPCSNYGIIEDSHHMILHILVQYIRVKNADHATLSDLVL